MVVARSFARGREQSMFEHFLECLAAAERARTSLWDTGRGRKPGYSALVAMRILPGLQEGDKLARQTCMWLGRPIMATQPKCTATAKRTVSLLWDTSSKWRRAAVP
jgi:hypothetical protein